LPSIADHFGFRQDTDVRNNDSLLNLSISSISDDNHINLEPALGARGVLAPRVEMQLDHDLLIENSSTLLFAKDNPFFMDQFTRDFKLISKTPIPSLSSVNRNSELCFYDNNFLKAEFNELFLFNYVDNAVTFLLPG
jgi:hypothetical protein